MVPTPQAVELKGKFVVDWTDGAKVSRYAGGSQVYAVRNGCDDCSGQSVVCLEVVYGSWGLRGGDGVGCHKHCAHKKNEYLDVLQFGGWIVFEFEFYKKVLTFVDMWKCNSSKIAEYGYDRDGCLLRINFRRSNAGYYYYGVTPEVFSEFLKAGSKGRFFMQNIKGKFEERKIG